MTEPASHSVGTRLPAWDGATYAANTGHHRDHDDAFLAPLPLRRTDRVLDVGCGSGDLTARIAAAVPDGHVVGLDASASMLAEAARAGGPNQSFVEGRAQDVAHLLPAPAAFDIVLTRAALHWVPAAEHPAVHAAVHRLLRPGGWYRIEHGGAGNVAHVQALLDDISAGLGGPVAPWTFPDAGAALDALEQAGFDVEAGGAGFVRTVGQRRSFDEVGVRGWLASQVRMAYEVGLAADAVAEFRTAVDARLGELRRLDGSFDLTYVRLDALVQLPP